MPSEPSRSSRRSAISREAPPRTSMSQGMRALSATSAGHPARRSSQSQDGAPGYRMATTPLRIPIIGTWSPKRARHRPRMRGSARMVTRWAPFVNRKRPLLEEPSGASKWSPPGVVMAASRILAGLPQRPEGLAEEPAGPCQLPRHRGGQSEDGGPPAVRPQRNSQPGQLRLAQQLLAPPSQDLHVYRSV